MWEREILGRRKEQIADGVVKTQNHLYNAFGCNRDNFSNSLLMTRKMHDKKYSRYNVKPQTLPTIKTNKTAN